MALWGGGKNGQTVGYGKTYQHASMGTVINDSGEIYVNFKIPVFSNASAVMPMQTLTDAQAGLDSDDTLYGTSRLHMACQVLVAEYGVYYEGMTARLFNIQSHYASASPANRIKITTVWSYHNRVHSGWNTGDTYPRITSLDTSDGEFRLNLGGGGEPDYWNSNTFTLHIINGGGGTPYIGNQTYDSRYGQDQAWK
jgi:hypothetical protein